MALNYSTLIKIPAASTFANASFFDFYQVSGGSGSGFASVNAALLNLKAANESTHGGTFSWTTEVVGANTEYTITWLGLTTDPELDPLFGDYISLHIVDDLSFYFSGKWIEVVELVDCIPSVCDSCYEINRPACEPTYSFAYDLEPATTYVVAFYSSNNNTYIQEVTTDGSGEFVVDALAVEFPRGFWTPETGGYIMKIFTDIDLATQVDVTINNVIYNCIQISFEYITTTTSSVVVTYEYLLHDYDGLTNYYITDDIGNAIIVG